MESSALRKAPPDAKRLTSIEAVVLDCDGVLTNGDIFYDAEGRRTLSFYCQRWGWGWRSYAEKCRWGLSQGGRWTSPRSATVSLA